MRRLALLFAFLTWGVPACAQDHAATLMESPAWVLKPTPAIDCNFALGAYYNCPLDKTFSITRASTKYCQWLTGIWMPVASGAPCITDQGWLIEEARTNDALQSRDMTQAVWVSVGMTEALNAVGIDGVANSASTLTATGTAGSCTASCTDLQTITLGSSADTYSVWLKRVTGSGTVNITINNLGAVTPCTLVATGFTRCTVTATLANPVIGIQMTVVNDVIVADFNQMEPGGFPTSPILTTSASATRAAESVALSNQFLNLLSTNQGGTILFYSAGLPSFANQTNATLLGSNAGRELIGQNASVNGVLRGSDNAGANVITATFGSGNLSTTPFKAALSWAPSSRVMVGNGGTPTTSATNLAAVAMSAPVIGSNANSAAFIDTYIQRVVIWPWQLPNAQLQMLTSLN